MVKASIEVVKNVKGRVESGTITIQGRKVKFVNEWDEDGYRRAVSFEGRTLPNIAELYAFVNQTVLEKVQVLESQPHMEDLTRQEWMADGSYTERWEQGFRRLLYHGRTGAYYRNESAENTPYADLTLPLIINADNDLEEAPYNNALNVKNSENNTSKNCYIGFPRAHFRAAVMIQAKLPTPSGATPSFLGFAFEVNSSGYTLFAGVECVAGVYYLAKVGPKGEETKTSFTPRFLDAYSRYFLVYDPPYLSLYEAQAGHRLDSPIDYPLTLTATIDLGTMKGKAIFCLFNESDSVCEWRAGNIWLYELPTDSIEVKQATATNLNANVFTKHDNKTYKTAVFDAAASGNLVAAVAAKVIKLHALTIQAQGTVVVNLNNGAAGTSLMEWSFQAREGAVIPMANAPAYWAITSVNTALYVTLSAAVTVTITAVYSDDDAS